MDGSDCERELVELFYDIDGSALRIPASGSRTKLPRPDVLGYYRGTHYPIEVKASSSDYCSFDMTDISGLKEYADSIDEIPYGAGRFSYDTNFYFVDMSDIDKPFSIKRNKKDSYMTFDELLYPSWR